MCGIAGVVNTVDHREAPSMDLLRKMAEAIQHRGPDEFGVYRDGRAGMINARLAIVDVVTGQQPMSSEDESLWIVFNGEIFNFVELREELSALGYHFRTKSDTEVIIKAYQAWSTDCFRRFNGQWAIALWDSNEHRLVLSRDRIGICPLFVRQENGQIWFGSEVKAIFADPQVQRKISPQGMDQTFTYWATVAPTAIFEGIEELRPASVRVYEHNGSHRDIMYYVPSYLDVTSNGPAYPLSIAEATEALREKLVRATRLRTLRADVPVGSYLSGGIDSSVIARMGREAKEGEFRTYSIRFEDSEFDETPFQRKMAATIDSQHSEYVVTKKEIAEVFPDVIHHTERPVLRTGPAPLFLLSRLVQGAGFKVVLTGEGADEMAAGYDIFREMKVREFMAKDPASPMRQALLGRLYPYLVARSLQQTKGMNFEFWKRGLERIGKAGFSHEPRWSTTSSLKRFFTKDFQEEITRRPPLQAVDDIPKDFYKWDSLSQAQHLEVATLLSPYVISSQGERMLMGHSVEGRFPFLDNDVMDFCNGLPAEYKLVGLKEKNILKRIAKGYIPQEIIDRKKQPYRAPDAICFALPGAPEYVAEMFSEAALAKVGIFEAKSARGLYEKCKARAVAGAADGAFSNTDNMGFIGILSTQLLHHEFVQFASRNANRHIEFKTSIDRISVLSQ